MPSVLLGEARGPDWPADLQQAAAGLFGVDEREAAAEWLAEAHRALSLSEESLGTLAAAVTRTWGRQDADQLVWRQLAGLKLALHCDFYEVVQVDPLARLCGGFLRERLPRVSDPLYEAASLVQVWCVRLTGYPLSYDYLSVAELDRFAGITSRYAADGLADPGDRLQLLRGVARTLQAHVRQHAASLSVPSSHAAGAAWDEVSWEEGQDSVFLYPPERP